jgi:hypothetical protein
MTYAGRVGFVMAGLFRPSTFCGMSANSSKRLPSIAPPRERPTAGRGHLGRRSNGKVETSFVARLRGVSGSYGDFGLRRLFHVKRATPSN